MANSDEPKSNTGLIIAIVAIVVLLLISSGVGFMGMQLGWWQFGDGGAAAAAAAAADASMSMSASDTAAPADDGTINYQGISIPCAITYKPSSDQFNTAVPPFDPSKCQGVELESNCQTWTPVQQGKTWIWQKAQNIDGCIPVQPDTVGVARGQTYLTDVGPVVPFPVVDPAAISNDPTAIKPGGGYGKDGVWRNARDAKQIVSLARSGRLRSSGRRTSTAAARMAVASPARRVATPSKTVVRRANADPAPMLSSPAYAQFAPYTSGLTG